MSELDRILYKALYNTLSIFSCLKKSFALMRVIYLAYWKNGPSNDADDQDNGKGVGAIKYERRINPYLTLLDPLTMNLADFKFSTIMPGMAQADQQKREIIYGGELGMG